LPRELVHAPYFAKPIFACFLKIDIHDCLHNAHTMPVTGAMRLPICHIYDR
jgi:hypothetical protein